MSLNENSNKFLQNQEIELIESMYPELIKLEGKLNSFVLGLSVNFEEKQFNVQLEIIFPEDYPSNASALYNLSSCNISSKDLNILSQKLDTLTEENKQQSIAFIWINSIIEFLNHNLTDSVNLNSNNIVDASLNKELKQVDDVDHYKYEDGDYDYVNYNVEDYKNMPVHVFENENANTNGLDLPQIFHGELVRDRKSIFQGHLSPISDQRQVDMVVKKLKENKRIDEATHNIISYRIDAHNGHFISGCFDDGEIHAGSRMLHLMNLVDARDVLVVVTRWYGGIHLGADRYKHINNITRDLLDQYGYIKEKPNKKKINTKKNSSTKLKR